MKNIIDVLAIGIILMELIFNSGCGQVDPKQIRALIPPTPMIPVTPTAPAQGRTITVGVDSATITDAMKVAKSGDLVTVPKKGVPYSEKNGETFPIQLVSGITLRGEKGVVVDFDVLNKGIIFKLNDNVSIEGFTFTSSTGRGMEEAIYGKNIRNVKITRNNFRMDGIIVQNCEELIIENNTFSSDQSQPKRSPVGMIIGTANDITIQKNTMAGTMSFHVVMSDVIRSEIKENIFVGAGVAIHLDNTTITTSDINYNLFWENGRNLENTSGGYFPPVAENILSDPLFLDEKKADFRLHPGSPARTAGQDGGMVGAQLQASIGLHLSPSSPNNEMAQSKKMEIMRFDVTAGIEDITIGETLAFSIAVTQAFADGIEIVELHAGEMLFRSTHEFEFLGRGMWNRHSIGTQYKIALNGGARKTFRVLIDTTNVSQWKNITFTLQNVGWRDTQGTMLYAGPVVGNTVTIK